jgi:type I restriction enzyme S subunit
MSELRPGWAVAMLGDVCDRATKWDPRSEPAAEFRYVDISSIDGQRIQRTTRVIGAEAPSRARQLVRAGDTVLSTVRTYLVNTAQVPNELDGATVSTGFCVLRPTAAIDSRFLFYRVIESGFVELLSRKQTGSSYPAVRDQDVFDQPIAVPPLAEQRRIVAAIEAHLSRLDAAETAVRSAKTRLDLLRRSLLAAAVAEGHAAALGDLLVRIEAGRSAGGPAPPAKAGEWGVIKVSAMTWGEFRPGENKLVAADSVDPRHEIHAGDLLVSRANTTEYVGAAVLVRETPPRLVLSDKSLRLIVRDGVDREWLLYALLAPSTRRQISAVATGTSDSMRNISQEKLRAVRVRVPDARRQRTIADELSQQLEVVMDLAAAADGALRKSAALRRSILVRAFAGELVLQDTDDEPASELLERIVAERAVSPGPTRKRRVRALA